MTREIELTKDEELIFQNYTKTQPCVVEDIPDAHNAFLIVGNQQFCITREPYDTEEEAQWFCVMLAKAIGKIVREMK